MRKPAEDEVRAHNAKATAYAITESDSAKCKTSCTKLLYQKLYDSTEGMRNEMGKKGAERDKKDYGG